MITIKQRDIFERLNTGNTKVKDIKILNNKKYFPSVTLESGINELQLQSDSMLIHRILQKRLLSYLNKNIIKFIRILINEMSIKSGKQDVIVNTRDSLLAYFLQ